MDHRHTLHALLPASISEVNREHDVGEPERGKDLYLDGELIPVYGLTLSTARTAT